MRKIKKMDSPRWFDEWKQDFLQRENRLPELTSEEIEKCLKYTMSGKVIPYHEKHDVRYEFEKLMIEQLGLNAPFLVRNRKSAIENSELCEEAYYEASDWQDLIRYYMEMHDGEYEEFCMMFVMLMKEYL